MSQLLLSYSKILEIVGDLVRVYVPAPAQGEVGKIGFGDLALIENTQDPSQPPYLAQVIELGRESVFTSGFLWY